MSGHTVCSGYLRRPAPIGGERDIEVRRLGKQATLASPEDAPAARERDLIARRRSVRRTFVDLGDGLAAEREAALWPEDNDVL
jgi:hypothetical protein